MLIKLTGLVILVTDGMTIIFRKKEIFFGGYPVALSM